ncbi:G5 domain-containing protein [Chloroflexota bacterium]
MRLYQSISVNGFQNIQVSTIRRLTLAILMWMAIHLLSGCAPPHVQQDNIEVKVTADSKTIAVVVPLGSTAGDALEAAGLEVGIQDRSEPAKYTVLSDGDEVRLIRVVEEFQIEEDVIPYETQILRNESLPEGERRLIQPGENGLLEITHLIVYEDGVEVSSYVSKTVVIKESLPEVVMIGSQAPFAILPIWGKLAYISAGNAWVMEESTGNRRPVVTTGDLDGRIFELSPDGVWLLYTRTEPDEDLINSLWVARIDNDSGQTFPMEIENVIHFADWVPGSDNGVVFSTVETNPNPPGWQANNDLKFMNFSENGWASSHRTALDPSSGGIYGWWGMNFMWSPDGENLLYTRPDGVGLVDIEEEALNSVYDVVPLQTRSDWAWVPDVAWSPDGQYLYLVTHAPQEGLSSHEESPLFDLAVIPLVSGAPTTLAEGVGMFAYPQPSPLLETEIGEQYYKLAFLQALVPTQSRSSGYRLNVMDRDGSNRRAVFPPEGAQGLAPQRFAWSPVGEGEYIFTIGLIYQGNLWLVNVENGAAQQLTGDGLTTVLDWK